MINLSLLKISSYKSGKELAFDGMFKWGLNEPNGNGKCLYFYKNFGITDYFCNHETNPVCEVSHYIVFELEGVCFNSTVDSFYVLLNDGVLLGLTNTKMFLNNQTNGWEIRHTLTNLLLASTNQTNLFPLGKI